MYDSKNFIATEVNFEKLVHSSLEFDGKVREKS